MYKFNNEFQVKSNLMFMNISKVTETIRSIGDKLFKISMRKIWKLKIIWIIILLFFLILSLIFTSSSTNDNFLTSYIDKLYTIFMAFTNIVIGDIHPITTFSRFISALFGIIEVATIRLSVTIFRVR